MPETTQTPSSSDQAHLDTDAEFRSLAVRWVAGVLAEEVSEPLRAYVVGVLEDRLVAELGGAEHALVT